MMPWNTGLGRVSDREEADDELKLTGKITCALKFCSTLSTAPSVGYPNSIVWESVDTIADAATTKTDKNLMVSEADLLDACGLLRRRSC